jgi:hypothetical protein
MIMSKPKMKAGSRKKCAGIGEVGLSPSSTGLAR